MHTERQLIPASTSGAIEPSRTWPWRTLAIGAAALVAVAAPAAITWDDDGAGAPEVRKPASNDIDAYTRDLVARGLIPPEALEPAVAVAVDDTDAYTRDLVARGLIPPETLSGG